MTKWTPRRPSTDISRRTTHYASRIKVGGKDDYDESADRICHKANGRAAVCFRKVQFLNNEA